MISDVFSRAREAWQAHWSWYVMEGVMLGAFMAISLWITLLVEHPRSVIRRRVSSAVVRRILVGIVIGSTVVLLIKSSWGLRTGAHFNPAVTLAYLRIGLIQPWDAAFYIGAHFLGGWLGLFLSGLPFREAARHPSIRYIVTQPGRSGVFVAFIAECLISFVLLATLLVVGMSELKSFGAFFAGALVFSYVAFESPLSGFGMNPARSVASAICMRDGKDLWLYIVAPVAGMALAARLFGPR